MNHILTAISITILTYIKSYGKVSRKSYIPTNEIRRKMTLSAEGVTLSGAPNSGVWTMNGCGSGESLYECRRCKTRRIVLISQAKGQSSNV